MFRGKVKSDKEKKQSRRRLIRTCCVGDVIDLAKVSDPAVASKILGDGFGVLCSEPEIVSPVSGRVKDVSDEGHTYAVSSEDGIEIIVFITRESGSDSIKPNVSVDQEIAAGDLLCRKENAEVAVIVTNCERFATYRIALGRAKSSSDGVIVYEL